MCKSVKYIIHCTCFALLPSLEYYMYIVNLSVDNHGQI